MIEGLFKDSALAPTQGKGFEELVAESNSLPPSLNWKTTCQPPLEQSEGSSGYVRKGRSLRAEALKEVIRLLEDSPNAILKDDNEKNPGFYSLDGKDHHGLKTTSISKLLEDITANDAIYYQIEKSKIPVPGFVADDRFLKCKTSADRKIAEDYTENGIPHPEKVGDYIRFQVLYFGAEDIAKARHTTQFGNIIKVAAYKDRLRIPHEETGHRAFLCRASVEKGNDSMLFELMLSMVQVETDGHDKTMRDSIRACKKMTSAGNAHFSAASGVISGAAQLHLMDIYSSIKGMDQLLDKDCCPNLAREWALASIRFHQPLASNVLDRLPVTTRHLSQHRGTGLSHAALH